MLLILIKTVHYFTDAGMLCFCCFHFQLMDQWFSFMNPRASKCILPICILIIHIVKDLLCGHFQYLVYSVNFSYKQTLIRELCGYSILNLKVHGEKHFCLISTFHEKLQKNLLKQYSDSVCKLR